MKNYATKSWQVTEYRIVISTEGRFKLKEIFPVSLSFRIHQFQSIRISRGLHWKDIRIPIRLHTTMIPRTVMMDMMGW